MKILFSIICFIDEGKKNSEMYSTYTKRTINDVLEKTPCDILVSTNFKERFIEEWNDRVIIRQVDLKSHKIWMGGFNQLLKFFAIKDIESKYDWVLYIDCDAGLTQNWDTKIIFDNIEKYEKNGYDMMATRVDLLIKNELKNHENSSHATLFSEKFIFYNVTTENGPFEWMDASMPNEHIFLIKNNSKLIHMCQIMEDFCYRAESQEKNFINPAMEAFEIGISAKLSGYNMGEMYQYGEQQIFKVVHNRNNIEKLKY
jgi:hypothetical protein